MDWKTLFLDAKGRIGQKDFWIGFLILFVGGIIPDVDIPRLQAMGVRGIFLPGSPMQHIINFINENVRPRMEQV